MGTRENPESLNWQPERCPALFPGARAARLLQPKASGHRGHAKPLQRLPKAPLPSPCRGGGFIRGRHPLPLESTHQGSDLDVAVT